MSVRLKKSKAVMAATTLCNGRPGDLGRTADESYMKVVWSGIVYENTPDITYPELRKLAGVRSTSHAGVHGWIERWRQLDWRIRHAWLLLAEALGDNGFSVRSYQMDMAQMRRELIAERATFRRSNGSKA